jgi:hypothetical protein
MKKLISIAIIIGFTSCAAGLDLEFSTPPQPKESPYLPPVHLDFRKNGRCILTSLHMGSDSGPVDFQQLGNYTLQNDTIVVEFIWIRTILQMHPDVETIEDKDWRDLEPFTQVFTLNANRDTLCLISDSRVKMNSCYILYDSIQNQ